jgi:hypothetical protein
MQFDENEQNDATEELPAEKPKKKVKKSKSTAGETKTKKTKTKKQTIEKQSISVVRTSECSFNPK